LGIGVIFCSCAGQITEKISFEKLKDFINNQVDWIEFFDIACSEEIRRDIIKLLSQRKTDGLIILGAHPIIKVQFLITLFKVLTLINIW